MTERKQPSVEVWEIERIVPYEQNAKKHPAEQIDKLARTIREFGWDQPIVVDQDGVIIKGHGRRLAAIQLGLKKVPVICRADLTPAQVKAARLADNRVVSTDYDSELIRQELAELHLDGFELEATGFDEKELAFLTADLDDLDPSAMTEDIEDAVGEQAGKQREEIEGADEQETPVSKVFGFTKLNNAEARQVRNFLAQVEDETGKTGKDALLAWIAALEG